MKMKPEERPKVIVMLIVIVALFGYFFVAVLPRMLKPDAPVAQAPPTPRAPASSGEAATTAAPPPAAGTPATGPAAPAQPYAGVVRLASQMGPPRSTSRDPFAMMNGVAGAQTDVARNTNVIQRPAPNPPVKDHLKGWAPPKPAPMPVAPPGSGSMTLDGVISGGSVPVAVIRVGERTLRKRAGDHLPDGLIIVQVTYRGIVVKRGKETLPFVEIGSTFETGGGGLPMLRSAPPERSGG